MRDSADHNTSQIEKQIENELLVFRCQDGELEAFRELVERWQSRLLRLVYRQTGDIEASADITQDCWLVVVRTLGKLADPALFRAWLFRIASNKCADWVRKQQRTRKMTDELTAEQESEVVDLSGDSVVVDTADHNKPDEITILRNALRRLPQEKQAILHMRYIEGIKTDQIAILLDIPAGTVKSRLYHAREALRIIIEK